MSDETYVIVGASLAGATAAAELRARGFDGRVLLLGAEESLPYERLGLSKGYLTGEKAAADFQVKAPDYYPTHDIEVLTRSMVTELNRTDSTVRTSTGQTHHYDKLLLTTGASPRMLDIPGAALAGVATLRTISDSDQLRREISAAERVIVIGAGWIGCEVAASARTLGAEVTMLTPDPYPLVRILGPEVGAVFADLHRAHGVDLRLGVGVEEIVGTDRVTGVRTSDGQILAGDLVVLGVGAVPRDELALAAGLDVDNGITVDEYLTTSDPAIFAAGDVANAWHPTLGTQLRVEHWDNAKKQGATAAANMLGQTTAYTALPFFFSDQYDFGIEYRGHASSWDDVVVRGDPQTREFLAFWLREGQVVAAMNANIWDQGDGIEALLQSAATPRREDLANPQIPLTDLASTH